MPVRLMTSKAYSLVIPPMTDGAETPGIHLLLITSTSNEMNITSTSFYRLSIKEEKTCPACVLKSFSCYNLCLLISFYIQITVAPFYLRY